MSEGVIGRPSAAARDASRQLTISIVAGSMLAGAGLLAQSATLDDQKLQEAINAGSARLAKDIGVKIRDVYPWSLWSQMDFGLTLHGPTNWVQYLSIRTSPRRPGASPLDGLKQ
jgi:hypothetical protein